MSLKQQLPEHGAGMVFFALGGMGYWQEMKSKKEEEIIEIRQ